MHYIIINIFMPPGSILLSNSPPSLMILINWIYFLSYTRKNHKTSFTTWLSSHCGSSSLARVWNFVSALCVGDFHWTLSLNFSSSWLNPDQILTALSLLTWMSALRPSPLVDHYGHVAVVAVAVVGHHNSVVRPGADGVVTHQTELTHCLGLEFSEGSPEPFGHDRVEKWIDDWIEVVKSPWKIKEQLILKIHCTS